VAVGKAVRIAVFLSLATFILSGSLLADLLDAALAIAYTTLNKQFGNPDCSEKGAFV
jgi:hypothetical protein